MNGKPIIAGQLRAATKAAHRQLDHHPLLAALLDTGIDSKRYGDALASLHGIFCAAERLVAGDGTNDFPYVMRTPALEADLKRLQRSPIPFNGHLPTPDTIGARIGMLYVLEGSALGGQVLARQLRASIGPDCPLQFFRGDGEQAAGIRWAAFWQYASTCPTSEFPAAEKAATCLFAAFSEHLDACLRHQEPLENCHLELARVPG